MRCYSTAFGRYGIGMYWMRWGVTLSNDRWEVGDGHKAQVTLTLKQSQPRYLLRIEKAARTRRVGEGRSSVNVPAMIFERHNERIFWSYKSRVPNSIYHILNVQNEKKRLRVNHNCIESARNKSQCDAINKWMEIWFLSTIIHTRCNSLRGWDIKLALLEAPKYLGGIMN